MDDKELEETNSRLAKAEAEAKEEKFERMWKLILQATKLVGKELKGDISDESVAYIAEMFIREEHMIGWMTTDEREAMQLDVSIRDHQIHELTQKLAAMKQFLDLYEGKMPDGDTYYWALLPQDVEHRAERLWKALPVDKKGTHIHQAAAEYIESLKGEIVRLNMKIAEADRHA